MNDHQAYNSKNIYESVSTDVSFCCIEFYLFLNGPQHIIIFLCLYCWKVINLFECKPIKK